MEGRRKNLWLATDLENLIDIIKKFVAGNGFRKFEKGRAGKSEETKLVYDISPQAHRTFRKEFSLRNSLRESDDVIL